MGAGKPPQRRLHKRAKLACASEPAKAEAAGQSERHLSPVSKAEPGPSLLLGVRLGQ
jgi:hypothetical protein